MNPQEVWRQVRASEIAELRAVVRQHQRDTQGRCTGCVAAGLAYPGGHRAWPCDARLTAAARLRRMGVDPYSEEEERAGDGG